VCDWISRTGPAVKLSASAVHLAIGNSLLDIGYSPLPSPVGHGVYADLKGSFLKDWLAALNHLMLPTRWYIASA